MSTPLQYETPENVRIEYHLAGLGTRFVAWFVDGIIVNLLLFLAFIGLFFVGIVFEETFREWFRKLDDLVRNEENSADPEIVLMYIIGIGMLIFGFGSFFYFGLSELFLRGQTLGKRLCHIRVVKLDGFALDSIGIFLRNVFRVIDSIPILWIVPFLSKKGQRFGDMVAGTVIVTDKAEELAEVRQQLSARNPAEAQFRFDHAKLSQLSQQDFETIERLLDRWDSVPVQQRDKLVEQIVQALCRRIKLDEPAANDRVAFLEDLLAAEYRRQERYLR